MEHPVDRASEIVGSQRLLADVLGVTKAAVWQWKEADGGVPGRHCQAIERATKGAVTVEELRPTDKWVRVPDPTWPHPAGRPLLDFAKPELATDKEGA